MLQKSIISVGVVAYNEEGNIANVLADILSQKQTKWQLNKIYVACGGCTDRTVNIVKSLHNKHINLIVNPKREGKAVDEQKIFDKFGDEILVMFDADVRLKNKFVIDRLIQTHMENGPINLVGGNARPFPPKTFFERAVYTTFLTLDASRLGLKGGNNIYGASGQCLAIRKDLVRQIKFPRGIIAEDDFIYFTNLKSGGGFKYSRDAIVYYKLPKYLKDYFRQTLRSDTASAIANVDKYFGSIVPTEYHRPISFYTRIVIRSILWNPIGSLYMICVRIISRLVIPFTSKHYSINWFTADSTK